MNHKTVIMAGFANNKTSLSIVFQRYVECFRNFCNPDIFDLGALIDNPEFKNRQYPQYNGKIDHPIKYIHTTFNAYSKMKSVRTQRDLPTKPSKKIGYFVWDSSDLHMEDADSLREFDEIWTPSEYCRTTFSKYVDASIVKIINHPVPKLVPTPEKFKKMTILVIGALSSTDSRKNLSTSLHVAAEIQKMYPSTNIVFKTWSASDAERSEIRRITSVGRISVIDSFYTDTRLQELISKCHIILSLHRSEGFGLTLAESLLHNVVPVSTNFSANTEFIHCPGVLVNYKLIDTNNSIYKGQWADPNIDDAIDKTRNALLNYPQLVEELRPDVENIKNNFNSFVISNKIKHTLFPSNKPQGLQSKTTLLIHPNSTIEEYNGGIFNPAAFRMNDRNYLMCRGENEQEGIRQNYFTHRLPPVLCEFDDDFQSIKNYKILNVAPDIKLEDFRSFTYNGELLFSTTCVTESSIYPCLAKLIGNRLATVATPTLLDFATQPIEKNWVFFERERALYLLYKTDPYTLFKHTRQFTFEKYIELPEMNYLKRDPGVILSNSINPFILDDDHFLHVVHTQYALKSYRHYPILISRKTLKPVSYSATPLFEKTDCFGGFPDLLYLTDYMVSPDTITWFFGESDICCTKTTTKIKDIVGLNWTPIPT